MRAIFLAIVTAIIVATALVSVAGAARITGTKANDTIRGTAKADVILGVGGRDRIYGLAGNDRIRGGAGNDTISGGAGNDTISGGTGTDRIICGSGVDHVAADRADLVARDCEVVSRPQTSTKPPITPTPPPAQPVVPVADEPVSPSSSGVQSGDLSLVTRVEFLMPNTQAGYSSDTNAKFFPTTCVNAQLLVENTGGIVTREATSSPACSFSVLIWQGRFANGTSAPSGKYRFTLTLTDSAKPTRTFAAKWVRMYVAPPATNPPPTSPIPYGQTYNWNSSIFYRISSASHGTLTTSSPCYGLFKNDSSVKYVIAATISGSGTLYMSSGQTAPLISPPPTGGYKAAAYSGVYCYGASGPWAALNTVTMRLQPKALPGGGVLFLLG